MPRAAMMTRRAALVGVGAAALSGCMSEPEAAGIPATVLSYDDLAGWADEDHADVLPVFQTSLPRARSGALGPTLKSDWTDLAARAARVRPADARGFFETSFTPVLVGNTPALFTAYYEPELAGSRLRGGPYQYPIYARPPELTRAPYLTRAQIAAGALAGRGLELFWLTDPVEAFFLEIQGSGRLRLPDGGVARVGFAGKNGHPYRSVGKVLVERGEMALSDASARSIKAWVAARPVEGPRLLNENPSFVFFTERTDLLPGDGPVGAMSVPVTAGRSIAVDPGVHPLGAPVWVETTGAPGFGGRLTVAQDVGGAIRGAQRADLFIGSGDVAGAIAGAVRGTGRMVTLLPNAAAARLAIA